MNDLDRERELREAKLAGQEALDYLNRAADSLQSAGNWGVVDMLGGGLISTFVKHSKMNDAEELVQQARSALKRFQKELMDVENVEGFCDKTWQLVCVDGFPLGWGKACGGVLKNKYLPGWRLC